MNSKSEEKKKLLFFPLHPTSWGEMYPLAKYMCEISEISFLLDNEYMMSKKEVIERDGFRVIVTESGDHSSVHSKKVFSWEGGEVCLRNILRMVRKSDFLGSLIDWYREIREASNQSILEEYLRVRGQQIEKLRLLNRLFDKEKYDACIVAGDRHQSGCELALLRVCKEKGIPAIIPPISYISDTERLLLWRLEKKFKVDNFPSLKDKYNGIVRINPSTNRSVYYYSPGIALAFGELDLLPENPWVMGGGNSSKLLADGEETRDRYRRDGCDPGKIEITGHPSHDRLYETLKKRSLRKKEFIENNSLNISKKVAVVSLPQLAEHGICDWNRHWAEINFLCESVKAEFENVVLSLHPKMDRRKYDYLESKYEVVIANERLIEYIAIADVFVSTFSSTVQWAALCHTPALVVDFYGLGYHSYDDFGGVVTVRNREEFKRILSQLLNDEEYYLQLVKMQANISPQISPFDGNCRERIKNSIINYSQDL